MVFPTLAGITDIIANNIPSLAGFAAYIGGSAPNPPASPPPSAPPLVDSMALNVAASIPSLEGTAKAVANSAAETSKSTSPETPVPDANASQVSLEKIINSLANVPSFTGVVGNIANPTQPMIPPTQSDTTG